jgi:hypothetical protein
VANLVTLPSIAKLWKVPVAVVHPTPVVLLVTNVMIAWIAVALVIMTESEMEMATTLVTAEMQPLVAVMIAPTIQGPWWSEQ